jgi:hypothetical protein
MPPDYSRTFLLRLRQLYLIVQLLQAILLQ